MTSIQSQYVQARKSQLNFYRVVPLFYQNNGKDFILYKPVGLKLSEMRIKDERYPDKLYLKRIDKLRGIQEVQKEFNQQLKIDIQSNNAINVKNTLVKIVQETFSEPRSGSIEGISETVDLLISDFAKESEILKTLLRVSNNDYTTVLHSINVMALGIGYAQNENFSKSEKRRIGLCALLHDVGKTKVNSEILQAPRKLNDEEFKEMKSHTIYGYDIINKCKIFNDEIKLSALQHHEKLDGSGYPYNITDISRMAQIVGLIDCYEALTNDDRPYRDSMAPLKALTLIKDEVVAGKYNRRVFEKFAYSLL
jgi:HD-GYP domain-containing protein (c-di-GMP phosphodiesterase class II)